MSDCELTETYSPADIDRGRELKGRAQTAAALLDRPEVITAAHRVYVDAGADWVILALRAPFDLDALERFAVEVAPAFTT